MLLLDDVDLLGDLEDIKKADNYYYAQRGLAVVTGAFTRINQPTPNSPLPPDGNTILSIFGDFLFRAIHSYQPGFERGKEEALASLCSLFASRADTVFKKFYLNSFYQGIEEVLHAAAAGDEVTLRLYHRPYHLMMSCCILWGLTYPTRRSFNNRTCYCRCLYANQPRCSHRNMIATAC